MTMPASTQEQPAVERRTSKLAIASFVSSLVFFVPFVAAFAAIVLGAVALAKISESRGALKGRPFAIAGIAIGLAVAVLTVIAIPFAFVGLIKSPAVKTAFASTEHRDHLSRIGIAVLMYQSDNKGAMPGDLASLFDAGYITRLDPLPFSRSSPRDERPLLDGYLYFPLKSPGFPSADHATVPIAWEKESSPFEQGIWVLCASGELKEMLPAEVKLDITKYSALYERAPSRDQVPELRAKTP
jgi:hypothetical protein